MTALPGAAANAEAAVETAPAHALAAAGVLYVWEGSEKQKQTCTSRTAANETDVHRYITQRLRSITVMLMRKGSRWN